MADAKESTVQPADAMESLALELVQKHDNMDEETRRREYRKLYQAAIQLVNRPKDLKLDSADIHPPTVPGIFKRLIQEFFDEKTDTELRRWLALALLASCIIDPRLVLSIRLSDIIFEGPSEELRLLAGAMLRVYQIRSAAPILISSSEIENITLPYELRLHQDDSHEPWMRVFERYLEDLVEINRPHTAFYKNTGHDELSWAVLLSAHEGKTSIQTGPIVVILTDTTVTTINFSGHGGLPSFVDIPLHHIHEIVVRRQNKRAALSSSDDDILDEIVIHLSHDAWTYLVNAKESSTSPLSLFMHANDANAKQIANSIITRRDAKISQIGRSDKRFLPIDTTQPSKRSGKLSHMAREVLDQESSSARRSRGGSSATQVERLNEDLFHALDQKSKTRSSQEKIAPVADMGRTKTPVKKPSTYSGSAKKAAANKSPIDLLKDPYSISDDSEDNEVHGPPRTPLPSQRAGKSGASSLKGKKGNSTASAMGRRSKEKKRKASDDEFLVPEKPAKDKRKQKSKPSAKSGIASRAGPKPPGTSLRKSMEGAYIAKAAQQSVESKNNRRPAATQNHSDSGKAQKQQAEDGFATNRPCEDDKILGAAIDAADDSTSPGKHSPRTGSQLSARVDGDGSPYPRSTQLPMSTTNRQGLAEKLYEDVLRPPHASDKISTPSAQQVDAPKPRKALKPSMLAKAQNVKEAKSFADDFRRRSSEQREIFEQNTARNVADGQHQSNGSQANRNGKSRHSDTFPCPSDANPYGLDVKRAAQLLHAHVLSSSPSSFAEGSGGIGSAQDANEMENDGMDVDEDSWHKSFDSHQQFCADTLMMISKRLVSQIAGTEAQIANTIAEYESNGTKLIVQMEKNHEQVYVHSMEQLGGAAAEINATVKALAKKTVQVREAEAEVTLFLKIDLDGLLESSKVHIRACDQLEKLLGMEE